MRKKQIPLFTITLLITPALRADYTFTTIDFPTAVSGSSFIFGMSGDTAVGSFQDTNNVSHGFTYADNVYTQLDYPGAVSTTVTGITGNTIVGDYFDGTANHDFIDANGVFSSFDAPLGAVPVAISGNTIIAVAYTFVSQKLIIQSFSITGGVATPIIGPVDATSIDAHGIFGDTIVGLYYTADGSRFAFTDTHGVFTTFNAPVPTNDSGALGISPDGIVGFYSDPNTLSSPGTHGFLYANNAYTTFDDPDTIISTLPYAVSGNNIAGYYYGDDGGHGFIATLNTPEPTTLALLALACPLLLHRKRK